MAHGLELRTPFLDREVMSVASRLARAEKTAAGTTKFALREAVGPLLPQEAAERRKLGFPVPIGHWFRGELSGYADQVIREARTEEWLDKRAVIDVLRRFRAGDPDVRGGRSGRSSCSPSGTRSTWSGSSTRWPLAGRPEAGGSAACPPGDRARRLTPRVAD